MPRPRARHPRGTGTDERMAGAIPADWRDWLRSNHARGCAPDVLFRRAEQEGFAADAISALLGGFRPRVAAPPAAGDGRGLTVHAAHGMVAVTNRVGPLIGDCLARLDTWRKGLPAAQRTALRRRWSGSVFTYVDTHGGVAEPAIAAPLARVGLVRRAVSDPIADKRAFGELAALHGLSDIVPRTFTSVADAMRHLDATGQPIMFCKGRHGTAGEQVRCLRRADVARHALGAHEVLQEAVVEPVLFQGRKMVFRVYLLVHDRRVHVSDRFFAVVHGADYAAHSDDPDVQVRHAGYMQPGSPVRLVAGHRLADHARHVAGIAHVAVRMRPLLKAIVEASDARTYMLLGADMIPTADGRLQLIEVNSYPNLLHTPDINAEVNVPMFTGLLKHTLCGQPDGHWRACAP